MCKCELAFRRPAALSCLSWCGTCLEQARGRPRSGVLFHTDHPVPRPAHSVPHEGGASRRAQPSARGVQAVEPGGMDTGLKASLCVFLGGPSRAETKPGPGPMQAGPAGEVASSLRGRKSIPLVLRGGKLRLREGSRRALM